MTKTTYPGSTTDRAAQIRTALKAKGWTSRDVSIRADYYSMGSSIRVVIKNAEVPLALVESLANAHESIDRDQFGEILSGGNRFVDVHYSSDATATLAARYIDAVKAAAAVLDADSNDNSLIPVAGADGFLIGRGHNGWGYSLWASEQGHLQTANTPEYLAASLAIKLQAEN